MLAARCLLRADPPLTAVGGAAAFRRVVDAASSTFDASVGMGALTMDNKFHGAAAVGTKVVFAPYYADVVGVYDAASNTFDASVGTGALGTHKFMGAAAVGTKVVFAPRSADVVGVYDAAANTFDAHVSTGALTMDFKFCGAAAVGTKVVFAPYMADVVGIYDAAANTFDASVSTGALTMDGKFCGAAAVGTKVVFAPFNSNAVGIYDAVANTFDASVGTGLTTNSKFCAAVAVGTKVVFVPNNVNVVGVFDVVSNTFDAISGLTTSKKFSSAAAVGMKVVFAPTSANEVGIFDAATNTFDARVSTGSLTVGGKFYSAAAVGNKVVFAPGMADVVGVFDTPFDGVCNPGRVRPPLSATNCELATRSVVIVDTHRVLRPTQVLLSSGIDHPARRRALRRGASSTWRRRRCRTRCNLTQRCPRGSSAFRFHCPAGSATSQGAGPCNVDGQVGLLCFGMCKLRAHSVLSDLVPTNAGSCALLGQARRLRRSVRQDSGAPEGELCEPALKTAKRLCRDRSWPQLLAAHAQGRVWLPCGHMELTHRSVSA